MAMVKTDSMFADRQGKEGGTIWRGDTCGSHMQAAPRTVKKETEAQRRQRKAFWECVGAYTVVMAIGTSVYWDNYSWNHLLKNRKGENYYISGENWFIKINIPRLLNGLDFLWFPPGHFDENGE